MNSNYPPGVTGFESAIAGHDERDGDDIEDFECPKCKHREAFLPTTLVAVDGGLIQEWTCPGCEHDDYREVDVEDYRPEPDEDYRDW